MYQKKIQQLKARRLYLNITIEQLSHIIGVADTLVGKWERSDSLPNLQNFLAWCHALDYNVNLSTTDCMVEDWTPNEQFIKAIKTEFRGVNYEYEIANFRDWYTSKGSTSTNWESLYRMWIRRSFKFNGGSNQSHQKDSQIVSTVHDRLNAVQNLRTKTSST
tara:strand:+ start:2989 stop:3474 length:486 start_codon:yes stop_codon:yes gene_type:complete